MVEEVAARVGIDLDGNGELDRWTKWYDVQEFYSLKPGFSKQIDVSPARIDLSELSKGRGFQFELRMTDTTKNHSKPMIDRVILEFE